MGRALEIAHMCDTKWVSTSETSRERLGIVIFLVFLVLRRA